MVSIKPNIGDRNNISLDDVCDLLTMTTTIDDLGQRIEHEKAVMIFCSKLSVTRAEMNSAGQLGHKPDMILVVDTETYDNEKNLMYYDKKYSIYKSYVRPDSFTELYCEVNASD